MTYVEQNGLWVAHLDQSLHVGCSVYIQPQDNLAWSGYADTITIDHHEISFTCDDSRDLGSLCFSVVNSIGEPIPGGWVLAWRGGEIGEGALKETISRSVGAETSREVFFDGVAGNQYIDWIAGAPGFRITKGSVESVPGELVSRRVQLAQGWGGSFLVEQNDEGPISGAAVFLRGRHMGETNRYGRVFVSDAKVPESGELRIEKLAWRIAWQGFDLSSPEIGANISSKTMTVRMVRNSLP